MNEHHESVSTVESPRRFNWDKHFLPLAIVAAAVLISGSILYSDSRGGGGNGSGNLGGTAKPDVVVPDSYFDDGDRTLGNADAKVVVVEFSDFQCPFCRSFWTDTLPQLKKEYIDTGKVLFVYRDYPLSFHAMALPSALAAECAGDQGKYWQVHDKIFSEQNKLEPTAGRYTTINYTEAQLRTWVGQIGLNMQLFNDCYTSKKFEAEIKTDMEEGTSYGVSGTPGFFVNGRYINGAQPFSVFKSVIDEELKK